MKPCQDHLLGDTSSRIYETRKTEVTQSFGTLGLVREREDIKKWRETNKKTSIVSLCERRIRKNEVEKRWKS